MRQHGVAYDFRKNRAAAKVALVEAYRTVKQFIPIEARKAPGLIWFHFPAGTVSQGDGHRMNHEVNLSVLSQAGVAEGRGNLVPEGVQVAA